MARWRLSAAAATVTVARNEYRAIDLEDLKERVATPVLDGRNLFDEGRSRKPGFIYNGVSSC